MIPNYPRRDNAKQEQKTASWVTIQAAYGPLQRGVRRPPLELSSWPFLLLLLWDPLPPLEPHEVPPPAIGGAVIQLPSSPICPCVPLPVIPAPSWRRATHASNTVIANSFIFNYF